MSFKLAGLGLLLMLPAIGLARMLDERSENSGPSPDAFKADDIPAQGAVAERRIAALEEIIPLPDAALEVTPLAVDAAVSPRLPGGPVN